MDTVKMRGYVEVTFEYRRHTGPRFYHGGVTLSFHPSQRYSFSSEASWPQDNYEMPVREAVERELLRRQVALTRTRVILKRISWDPVSSCQVAFEAAARAATSAAYEL